MYISQNSKLYGLNPDLELPTVVGLGIVLLPNRYLVVPIGYFGCTHWVFGRTHWVFGRTHWISWVLQTSASGGNIRLAGDLKTR